VVQVRPHAHPAFDRCHRETGMDGS
jgi:hypothetical protein